MAEIRKTKSRQRFWFRLTSTAFESWPLIVLEDQPNAPLLVVTYLKLCAFALKGSPDLEEVGHIRYGLLGPNPTRILARLLLQKKEEFEWAVDRLCDLSIAERSAEGDLHLPHLRAWAEARTTEGDRKEIYRKRREGEETGQTGTTSQQEEQIHEKNSQVRFSVAAENLTWTEREPESNDKSLIKETFADGTRILEELLDDLKEGDAREA